MREVTTAQAAQMLREADDILILTHQYPDGDTLGCAFAMCRGLLSMGKRARVVCSCLLYTSRCVLVSAHFY